MPQQLLLKACDQAERSDSAVGLQRGCISLASWRALTEPLLNNSWNGQSA